MNLEGLPCHSFEHDGATPVAAIIQSVPPWDEHENCPMSGGYAVVAVWTGVNWQNERRRWRHDPDRRPEQGGESWDFAPWLDPRNERDIDSITQRINSLAMQQHEVAMKRIKSLELKLGKVAAQAGREAPEFEPVGVSDSG